MQKKLSKQNNSGFTLSEVLIAVAILIVLMGLAMIPITRHQRDLRQTELDAKAEIVYHAAQNKLSELLANGRISDCYAEDLQPLNNTPLDAAERKTSLHYVTSAAKTGEGSAAEAILPEDQVDRQLWDNHWVIELDPASGSVYAVFYSEKPLTYDFDSFNPLRFRDGRLSAGATVGYYGGDSVQSEITGKLTPHMEIINKEQLLLRVTCDTPMEPLHFYVTVSDGVHSTSRIELTGSEVKTDYLTYTATMVLDSLTDGMRFGQQARFKNKNLTPGADLTITMDVTCENRLVDSASGTLTANSLFAEVRGGDTAVVTYARHLQNLDTASRLPDSITRAVQEQDIQFVNENTDDGWDRLYGSRTFTPITNSRLTYCESKATVNGQVYHPVIYGLTVNTTGDGGLFAAFSGTLKNLRLCGADITASGNAGGLVGRNSGTVRASGVSAPRLFANSLFATLCTGGFAGGNSGVVQQCYAMADIEIGTINGGGVTLGGFAGSNTGSLRASYCATAMTSPSADIHGFAPTAGGVSGCCYLNGGTYRFVDSVHLYQYTDRSGAAPVNEPALRGMATRLGGFGVVSAANTFQHDKTLDSAGKAYPYPGIVVGHDGSRVHYGDWVTPADMGVLGLLYWEYESKPTGSGYYFSSIGVEDGEYKTNSSLCVSHDDGGTVTAYGYGYYWSAGSTTEPELSTGITVTGTRYTWAADDLHRQMPEFNFVTYKTSDNGLHLTSGTQANDAWTLTHEDAALTYTVSPFFADSFALSSNNAPGTASKPYQVRSIAQLQYINWSYINGQGSTTRDVTGSNSDYKYYPYLQYTNRRDNALQTKAMALAGDSTGGPRPILTWQQTHDLNGAGHGTATDGTAANYDFHPIAGAVNNGQLNNRGNETYDLTLYNWFGGIYDGGNYYIKNVNITSHCYNVGLFGTTAGAEIKNIVLYSDNDAVIQRKTDATPASGATGPENYATSYALGGLVGIAYDYDENLKDKTKVSTISNCAIAGYTVTDNSKNRQFLGEAAIGGLVGVSSANLNRCSAVVKLNINCTHRYASETNTGAMNKAQWGNYVRVGGLVGGVRYDVSDCYTGGSITVANDLLNERILTGNSTNTAFVDRYESTPKAVKMTQGGAEAGPDTYVYIGGIGGSGFSATFSNFSGSKDGQPTYNNCYTYVTFPAMEGTITGISLIGSIADRAGVSGGTARLTINNCYYLDSSAAISFGNLPTFYSKSNSTWSPSQGQYIYTYYSLATLLNTDAARMDMLRGDLSYLSKYTWNTGSSPYTINGLTALSYEQMSGRADIDGKSFTALLNGGSDDGSFHWVTTEENGQSAHGKYSFPGSAAALRGQDYPFPTVLTQGTACLHYGEWPTRGLYWSSGVLSLDRITTPSVTLSLHFTQDTDADAVPVITCSREGIVNVSVPQAQTPPADVRHSYSVTLTGLSVGSTEVFATLGGYTARLLVSVTSTLDISVDGLPGDDFFVGATCNLTLTARDSHGSALDVNWTVTPQYGNSVLTASVPVTKADRTASVTLTATGEGEDRTMVTATYTAGGESFTSKLPLVLPVRMQGVLGIANTSDEPPVYQQGVMNKDGTAFTDDVPSGAPYTDRPAYAGAKLYLYSRGSAATFDGLSVSGVTVKGGADATEYVLRPMPVSNDEDTSVLHPDVFRAENDDFRVTVGTPAKDTTSAFTYRPLTVKGRSQGQITLTVTLTDAENHAFTLSIPYTLTEEDTRVTATLRVDEQAFTLSVPYGTAPTAEDVARLLTDNGISPDTIDSWTPDITQPLYADTAFTAVRKTTDSGGAPTVPDADTPASGSKDPEDTPSDDPSAPDSSSSGTDPTPEPSPDTLP